MPRITDDLYFNENEIEKRLPDFYDYCKKKGLKFHENDFPVNLKTGEIFAPLIDVRPDLNCIESISDQDLHNPDHKIYNIGNLYIGNGCSLHPEQKKLLQQLNHEINERNLTKNEAEKEDLICVIGGYGAGFPLIQIQQAADNSEDLYCKVYPGEELATGMIFANRNKVFHVNSNIKNADALYSYVTKNFFSTEVIDDLIDKILEAARQKNVTLLTEEQKEDALSMYKLNFGKINFFINNAKNADVEEIATDLCSIFEQLMVYSLKPDWEVVEKILEKYNIQHTKPSAEITEKIPENSKVLDEWKNYLNSNIFISNQYSDNLPSCNVMVVSNYDDKNTSTKITYEAKSTELPKQNSLLGELSNNMRPQRSFSF